MTDFNNFSPLQPEAIGNKKIYHVTLTRCRTTRKVGAGAALQKNRFVLFISRNEIDVIMMWVSFC